MKRLPIIAALCLFAAVPPARAAIDYYELDRPHTQILFSVDHLGFSHSYGKFLDYKGHFTFDPDHPEKSAVDAVISTASLDMGDRAWNDATRKFFHTDRFPEMSFKSTGIKVLSKNSGDITGDLTLLGVTRPVTLRGTFNKAERNMFGKYVAGFSAQGKIKRSDFGMTDGLPFVGDEISIIIEAEGNRRDKPGEEQYNP